MRLKVAGAFFNSCGITSHSHSITLEVLTAVSNMSLGRIKVWLKSSVRSMALTMTLPDMELNTMSFLG